MTQTTRTYSPRSTNVVAWFQKSDDGTSVPGVLLRIGNRPRRFLPLAEVRALAARLEVDPDALGVPGIPGGRVARKLRQAADLMEDRAGRPPRAVGRPMPGPDGLPVT